MIPFRKSLSLAALALTFCSATAATQRISGVQGYRPQQPLTLWYTQPAGGVADPWMEYSLPIGNGQLGASLFGGVGKDQVLFNEKTVWSGRNALSEYGGGGYGSYQYFGSFFAEELDSAADVSDYVRSLDLTTGVGAVSFRQGGVSYERRYIASYPAQVIAAYYGASENGKVNLRFSMESGIAGAQVRYDGAEARFNGKLDLVSYDALLRIVPTGGKLEQTPQGIEVRGADAVFVILSGATDYDIHAPGYVSGTETLDKKVRDRVNAAVAKGWTPLLQEHKADVRSLMGRVSLQLGNAANTLPTDKLVDAYQRATGRSAVGRMLEQLYFQYGRYLEVASSRGVDLPSNLQGIWNGRKHPDWNSDIHANINVQMNYWPAEPTNLSEMHLPFLNYIISEVTEHDEWARQSTQTKGWELYTENNIFGGGSPWSKNYVIANAWYCTHLWQHYRYTLDKDFLRRAFPVMWSCTEYWLERMEQGADGSYEAPREYSPEQGPQAENATAHAQQLVMELLLNTRDAADALGRDAGLTRAQRDSLDDYLRRTDTGLHKEVYTGAWGSPHHGVATGDSLLREWKYSPYTVGRDGHRHQSHLMALYPFAQVTPSSPYFQAAVNSLRLRSDASTGWSMGWRVCLWARAQDGDHALTILRNALRHASSYGCDETKGGIYYNLLDSHAPFQIDGNFGACAGIAEMLLQSATDTLSILPALPALWDEGSVTGLKAVGNFTVDITWSGGKATEVRVVNGAGQPLALRIPGLTPNPKLTLNGKPLAKRRFTVSGDLLTVSTRKGDIIVVQP